MATPQKNSFIQGTHFNNLHQNLTKTLFINTSLIRKVYKGIRHKKKRGKNLKDVKLAHKLDEQNLSILTTNHYTQ
jgi:hypothetical protein